MSDCNSVSENPRIPGKEYCSQQNLRFKSIFPSSLSITLNYYSTSLTAQDGPNYTSHFVKVPFCSICSVHVCADTNTHTHADTPNGALQTDNGRSRHPLPSGDNFVYKNSWTSEPPVKCGDKRNTVTPLCAAEWLWTWIHSVVHLSNS